jgi:imidazolonepropionase-like amidohydrolase
MPGDGPDDIRRAIREQIRAGADFIKVMTTGARSNELEDPVAEGKLADLIIVDGDPLTEPQLLCDPGRIWLVLQLGPPVAGHALSGQALSGQALSSQALSRPVT